MNRLLHILILLALLWPTWGLAAQPTLSDYQESNFSDNTSGSETTASATWSSGDLIVVLGITADNGSATLATPTASGLTFSAVSGTPTNTTNRTKVYAWTATAGAGGSGTIAAVKNDIITSGLAAFVFTGSDGIGGAAISAALGSTTTQSLTRTGENSHVVQIWGDWNAVNDTTVTWTPSGETQREAVFVSGQSTFFVASWGDQGASGTTSYGFSGFAGGQMSAVTLEIVGTSGGGGGTVPRLSLLGVGP